MARDIEGAVEIDVDHRVPLLLGHFTELAVARDAGAVDQDVDGTDFFSMVTPCRVISETISNGVTDPYNRPA